MIDCFIDHFIVCVIDCFSACYSSTLMMTYGDPIDLLEEFRGKFLLDFTKLPLVHLLF